MLSAISQSLDNLVTERMNEKAADVFKHHIRGWLYSSEAWASSFRRKISKWYAAAIHFEMEAGIGHSEVSTDWKSSALHSVTLKGLRWKHVPPKGSGESSCGGNAAYVTHICRLTVNFAPETLHFFGRLLIESVNRNVKCQYLERRLIHPIRTAFLLKLTNKLIIFIVPCNNSAWSTRSCTFL